MMCPPINGLSRVPSRPEEHDSPCGGHDAGAASAERGSDARRACQSFSGWRARCRCRVIGRRATAGLRLRQADADDRAVTRARAMARKPRARRQPTVCHGRSTSSLSRSFSAWGGRSRNRAGATDRAGRATCPYSAGRYDSKEILARPGTKGPRGPALAATRQAFIRSKG